MITGFRSFHPLTCFVYYAGIIIFSMLLFHPLFFLTSLSLLIVLNYLQDGAEQLRKWMYVYIGIGLLMLIINPFLSHRGNWILFYFQNQPITMEAVIYSLTVVLSIYTILIAFHSYNLVITADKFLYLFSSLSPKAAMLTMMAMRFIPLLRRRLQQIAVVQQTRGIDPLRGPWKHKLKDGVKLLQILLTWTLEEAVQTANSMQARGYGAAPRTSYFPYVMRSRDFRLLVLLLAFGCMGIAFWVIGAGVMTIYPIMEKWSYGTADWLCYLFFVLYLLMPIVLEGREIIRWRSSS